VVSVARGFSLSASATDVGAAEVTLGVFDDALLGVVEAVTGATGLVADAPVTGELTAATTAGQR
jgi:hypothetical protein